MLAYTLSDEANPSAEDVQEIYSIVVDYCLAQVGDHWKGRVAIFARDPDGQILGGITGFTDRGWLRIELLGVKERWRGQGMGAALLGAAEALAVARGCHNTWLDTYSFANVSFYQRHGYQIFGTLENYPTGHARYFVRKSLSGNAASAPPER